MPKTSYNGQFPFPLKHKVVRNLKIVTEIVGVLDVQFVGYFNPDTNPFDVNERYAVDIDAIIYNGVNIKEILEVRGDIDDIVEAAQRHFARVMEAKYSSPNKAA